MTALLYVLSLSVGAVSTAFALAATPHLFTSARHRKMNYRGREVFATAGIVLSKSLFIGCVASALYGTHERVPLTILAGGCAMGLLGYLDDVYGDRHAGGLIGHAKALLHGRLTTGMLKAVGGVVVGLIVAHTLGWRGPWVMAAGAVVALSANLTNLLDLRPGRALKVWSVAAAALLIGGIDDGGALPVATVLAGCAVFAVPELREEVMLGDSGANMLGTVLGIAAIASVGRTGLLVILGVLVVLTALSERVSFTQVIEATPPLRWLDGLGRSVAGGG